MFFINYWVNRKYFFWRLRYKRLRIDNVYEYLKEVVYEWNYEIKMIYRLLIILSKYLKNVGEMDTLIR